MTAPARRAGGTRLLVLQAYGRPRIVQEARFAILTFLHFALGREGWKVVVYTDRAQDFADLGPGVTCEPMEAGRQRHWRGDIDFVHRVKLELLIDCLARHEGRILYVDSDTYFTGDPWPLYDAIDPRTALMHEREGRLAERKNGIFRKMHRFVTTQAFPLPGGETVRMSPDTEMWNAGVIGLDPAVARALLGRALVLTDVMYARYAKHVQEQLAVSWVLQTSLALRTTVEEIHHYWRSCPEFEGILGAFFDAHRGEPLEALAAAAFALKPVGTPPPPKRPWWQRLLGLRPTPPRSLPGA